MSVFAHQGVISDYICNQDELDFILHRMMNAIDTAPVSITADDSET